VSEKKDAAPALVMAMAKFNMALPPGTPEPGVLELLKVRTDVVQRLTEKPKMQDVLSYLLQRAPVQEPYVLEQWQLMSAAMKIPDEGASSAEKAAAILLHCAVNAFSQHFPVWSRGDVEKGAEPFRVTAQCCRAAAADYPRVTKQAAELADSFLRVAEYFDEQYKLNMRGHLRYGR
jgi:hypothetical protein